MNEEIKFRTGVDTRPFAQGMRSITGIAKDAGRGIESSFSSIGTRLGASFGISAIIAGLSVAVSRAMDLADEIRGASDAGGVGGEFLQSGRLFANENGSNSEAFTKGIAKLNEKIGDVRRNVPEAVKLFKELGIEVYDAGGKAISTEDVYGSFADKLKAIEDPAIRASVAAEIFGEKLASKLTPALMQGSAALKEFTQENKFKILDERELATLDAAKDKLEALKTSMLTGSAKLMMPALNAFTGDAAGIAGFKAAAEKGRAIAEAANILAANGGIPPKTKEQIDAVNKALDALRKKRKEIAFESSDTYTKLLRLQTEEKEIKAQISVTDKNSVEGIKLQTTLEENQAKIRKQQKGVEKEISDEKERQRSLSEKAADAERRHADAAKSVKQAQQNLSTARADRSKFDSVQGLADSMSPDAWKARQVLEKERQADWWKQRGDERMANIRFSEADKIREGISGLTEGARNPFKNLEDQLKAAQDTAKATSEIQKTIAGATIPAKK